MEIGIDQVKPGTFTAMPNLEALHILSMDLFHGCGFFAKIARESDNGYETIVNNTACVFFAVNAMEAKTNELASFLYRTNPAVRENPMLDKLFDAQAVPRLEDKWNLIASLNSGVMWEKHLEPFASYEIICSIKNRLVNCEIEYPDGEDFLDGKLEKLMLGLLAENISIKGMGIVKTMSDLLAFKDLGIWIYLKAISFEAKSFPLLVGKI
jgi:hypothetical protein